MIPTWPQARLYEAMVALAERAGLAPRAVESPAAPRDTDEWISGAAEWLGIEAEPVRGPYGELGALLRGAAPALVKLEDGQLVALAGRRGRDALVLTPELEQRRVAVAELRRAMAAEAERKVAPEIDRLLASAGADGRMRERAREALLAERLSGTHIGGCWMLRSAPGAPLLRRARQAGLGRRLGVLAVAHVAQYALWLCAWYMVGRGALEGRFDKGFMLAWALLLLTLIPLRLVATLFAGLFAVDAGALIKQRLLCGALRLSPDEVRHQGAGQLLGRVIESEAVEQLALSGGTVGAVALVELGFAGFVLAAGAGGLLSAVLLGGWIALAVALTARLYRERTRWTDARLDMTHELCERLVGHRTRLCQELPEKWHEGEDEVLERYAERSRRLDRAEARLLALVPRGWLLVGLLGLGPAFIAGAQPGALAIGIGGLLLAWRAMQRLVQGLSQLAGAAISWRKVAPLSEAAARVEPAAPPAAPAPAPAQSTVLEAHDVVFRYRERGAPVVRGANLRVGARDRLLVQGPSGGGKSTLGALLAGLRVPESGLLLLGGLDRRTLGADGWRRRVAAAPQFHENHVLVGTFAFNLLMGRGWPPRPEDLVEAEAVCRELDLGPLLDRMPAGMQQMVGETGWQLSHGERSRLYIARALMQHADVIVLDESFAALDPETLSRSLQCVLLRAPAVVVIAHP